MKKNKKEKKWQTVKLKDIALLITKGTTPTTIGENFVSKGVNFIKSESITRDGRIDKSKFVFIDAKTNEKLKRSQLKRNDLLCSIAGMFLGKVAIVKREYLPANTNQAVAIIRLDKSLSDPYYIKYYFLQERIIKIINSSVGQSAQPNINLTQLGNIDIVLPPLPVQQRIASVLSVYDELVENNTKRIKVLEELAQAVYNEWFVRFRFPGYEKVKMIDSGTEFGKIPEGWEVRKVSEMIKRISSGKKYNNKTVKKIGTVPVLDQGRSGIIGYHDDEPGVMASEENPVIVFANHTCYQRLIQYPFSTIQNVLPFYSSDENYRNIYWLHWATKDIIKFNDYKGHWPEFIGKEILVPTPDLCDKFGEFAKLIVRQIYKLEQINQNLRQTRDLLLPKLVSGEVEVK